MADQRVCAKPFNIRLPVWAVEYIEQRSARRGTTKTQVVVEALSRLRADDLEELMRQGYQEMREINRAVADDVVAATAAGLQG